MDRYSVVRHLKAWADGVDPATGEALEADHPGQRPDSLRVIFAAIALLEFAPGGTGPDGAARSDARNAGRPWSTEDDAALAFAFDAGTPIGELADRFERTRGSINARLVKLGKIEVPPGMRLRGSSSVAF